MIVILTYKRSIHAFNCEAHRGRRRPVAYHAACRMGIRLAVAAVTSGLVAKNAILDNGNRDQTLGRYHACDSLWMVLMVPAISPARRHYAVCDPRQGDYRRAGCEVMGKGARTGAAAICGLA